MDVDKEIPCCGATRPASEGSGLRSNDVPIVGRSAQAGQTDDMIRLDGGSFLMGTDYKKGFPSDGEGPIREIHLRPFWIDPYSVTNRRFAAFVDATGYETEAERFGWSYVFFQFLPEDHPPTRAVPEAPWWRQVFGADWRHPEGPHSNLTERQNHPVVHISWNDALVFAAWEGKRLPTEAEWEYAARGGLKQKRYPWGDRLLNNGKHQCNIWQGEFPNRNSGADGWLGTCPVDTYKPNRFGLYNMSGNVWEWCADYFSPDFHQIGPRDNPVGPPGGTQRVMRGGSYLCHKSYCNRYRVAARTANTPDSSTGHMGLRLVMDVTD